MLLLMRVDGHLECLVLGMVLCVVDLVVLWLGPGSCTEWCWPWLHLHLLGELRLPRLAGVHLMLSLEETLLKRVEEMVVLGLLAEVRVEQLHCNLRLQVEQLAQR